MVRGGHIVKNQEVCFQDNKGRTTRSNANVEKKREIRNIKDEDKEGIEVPISKNNRGSANKYTKDELLALKESPLAKVKPDYLDDNKKALEAPIENGNQNSEVDNQDLQRDNRSHSPNEKNEPSLRIGFPAPESFLDDVKLLFGNFKASPNTPHRIQLEDVEEFEPKPETKLDLTPKVFNPPPKARRKLNNNKEQQMNKKNVSNNKKLTDFFPLRKSERKTKTTVLEEKQRSLENLLRNYKEEGLEVHNFEGKGRGIVASKSFLKGDFVVEYSGELIDMVEAKKREQLYAKDRSAGCYMYYFKYKSQQYCIDATAETGKLGRLVNHSRNGNLVTRTISVDNIPRLILVAKKDIEKGEELTYDYGDRSKESLKHHPWLAF